MLTSAFMIALDLVERRRLSLPSFYLCLYGTMDFFINVPKQDTSVRIVTNKMTDIYSDAVSSGVKKLMFLLLLIKS